jgi:hypothetical protein
VTASGERRRRLVLLLVGLALTVRLAHLAAIQDGPLSVHHRLWTESDMRAFDDWALRIEAGDVLGRAPSVVPHRWYLEAATAEEWQRWLGGPRAFFKAPAYPYLLALVRRLAGDPWLPMSLLQIAASAWAVALLFALTTRQFGTVAGAAAATWLALYGPDVHYDTVLLRGPFITLVGVAATLLLVRLRPGRVSGRAALSIGLVCGAGLLLHEGLAPLPLLVAGWLAWQARPAAPRVLAAFTLGIVLTLLPLMARNVAVGASPLQLAANGAATWAMNNAAQSDPLFFEARPEVFVPLLKEGGGSLGGTALACLRTFEGPWPLARHYLKRSVGLVAPFENVDNTSPYYAALRSPVLQALPGYAALLPFVAVGLLAARGRARRLLPLLPVVLVMAAGMLLNLPMSRYRASLAVVLMPVAGLGVAFLVRAVRERRAGWLAAAVLLLAATTLGAHVLERRFVYASRSEAELKWRPQEFVLGMRYEAERQRWPQLARESRDLASRTPLPDYRLMALLSLARAEAARGRGVEAAAAAHEARRAGSDDPTRLLAAGDLFRQSGDVGMARVVWAAALEHAKDDATRALLRSRLEAS